jgi:hypothetical protein
MLRRNPSKQSENIAHWTPKAIINLLWRRENDSGQQQQSLVRKIQETPIIIA